MHADRSTAPGTTRRVSDLVFVGFNRHVAALDRYTGEIAWQWKAPEGSGFVTILVDGDRLIVAVNGYTYCLDPIFGQTVWTNPMKGFGVGVSCLASIHGSTPTGAQADVIRQEQEQAAAAG